MVSTDNTVARALHDLGSGRLVRRLADGGDRVNGAAAVVEDSTQRLRVANSGWACWTPLNLAGIAAHLAGGAVLTRGQQEPAGRPAGRGRHQRGQDRPDCGRAWYHRLRPRAGQEAGVGR